MNLTTTQTVLTTWAEQASTLELEWGRQPQKVHMGAFILAYAGPMTKLGHDERIQTYGDDGDNTAVRVVGVRHLPVTFSFRSFDQRLGGSARQYAEEFRTLIHTTTAMETLTTAEIALVDTADLVETDYSWSGRMVSQVDLDVIFALRANFSDPLHDGSYINEVQITSTEYIIDEGEDPITDLDGTIVIVEV